MKNIEATLQAAGTSYETLCELCSGLSHQKIGTVTLVGLILLYLEEKVIGLKINAPLVTMGIRELGEGYNNEVNLINIIPQEGEEKLPFLQRVCRNHSRDIKP